jgi:hypothetical protein
MLVVGLVVVGSSSAQAETTEPFISGGVVLGGAIHAEREDGFLLGGELSAGVISADQSTPSLASPPRWVGGYVDVIRDFGSDTTRLSLGPEVGWRFLALDGGVVRELGDDPAWGFTIRPAITVGVATAFVRYTRFGADHVETDHVEIGVLLKLPHIRGGLRW